VPPPILSALTDDPTSSHNGNMYPRGSLKILIRMSGGRYIRVPDPTDRARRSGGSSNSSSGSTLHRCYICNQKEHLSDDYPKGRRL
jgi:hypothetical protein